MTTEQNDLADELERNARYSIGSDRSLFNRAAAALRAAGEPVAWTNEAQLGFLENSSYTIAPMAVMWSAAGPSINIPLYAAQPAPSASVREALENIAARKVVRHGDHLRCHVCGYNSVYPHTEERHAPNCARQVARAALSSTPSPLMAAGEAAETDIMETLDRKIEHAKCMQKRAFDHGLDVQGERMHARQEAFLEVKAILMKGSVATSPAKRGYVARVMGDAPPSFQMRVRSWMMQCFSMEICRDWQERNHRFLEEALELVQAIGCTASEAHQLVDYVYGRDQGEVNQEVGGVMVTLAALCLANDIDMHQGGEVELARIFQPEIMAKIRAKQAGKPKHSPLPQAMAEPTREEIAAIVDPNPFIVVNHRHLRAIERQKIALEKADAILALKPRGGQAA